MSDTGARLLWKICSTDSNFAESPNIELYFGRLPGLSSDKQLDT
ncbi:MAG TPA: hypothetical protein VFQ59_01865 [Candidatus Paceibacterota bacterium]|nr:hypothetical protein [Candidatus Paceibacterota bacterium]